MQSLFLTNGIAWKLLRDTPDRYIYEAVRKGVDIPLPEDIEEGINDVSQRDGWNKPAATEYALPTETWREHIARRQRCLELRQKLIGGEISSINDMITYNLNIRQLAQDVIENCYDPELVWAFYQAITKITILDPTCGSGAFLFAALNILEPLYDACLEQMQIYLDEGFKPANDNVALILDKFSEILQQINHHPNRRYFILKTIIINNLYGVDIMQEATEICKLRLYLKLASQVDVDKSKPNNGIEPLPDIDFNIRAGNTLVGFTSLDEVKETISKENSGQLKLAYDNSIVQKIEDKAQKLDDTFQEFRHLQIAASIDTNALYDKKSHLRESLGQLQEELDNYLADEYERGLSKKQVAFQKWKDNYEPFHWFVEFYGIMKRGGFDVIIGNPPYVELSKLRQKNLFVRYLTQPTGNLYCLMLERSTAFIKKSSKLGMIVPMSLSCTERMLELRDLLEHKSGNIWISHFSGDAHPSKLFEGVKLRLNILICNFNSAKAIYSSPYLKWFSDARSTLFYNITYNLVNHQIRHLQLITKTGFNISSQILQKVFTNKSLSSFMGIDSKTIYVHRVLTMYVKCFDFIPYFWNEKDGIKKSDDYKAYTFISEEYANVMLAILNSSTFFFYFISLGDCFHCGKEFITTFPINLNKLTKNAKNNLSILGQELMKDMKKNAVRCQAKSQQTGSVEYDQFWPRHSKSIMNQIDDILAQHYGFTDEELDFIINYDIKYRMGRDSEDENDV